MTAAITWTVPAGIGHPSWCDPRACMVGSQGPWHRSRTYFTQLNDGLGTRIGIYLLSCTVKPEKIFVQIEAFEEGVEEPVMELMLGMEDLLKLCRFPDSVLQALLAMDKPVGVLLEAGL